MLDFTQHVRVFVNTKSEFSVRGYDGYTNVYLGAIATRHRIPGCPEAGTVMMKSRNVLPIVAFLLIVLGVMTRLLPHEPNFTSVAAVALFGAVYLRPKYALFLPLAVLVISDFVIGFDSIQSRLSVYGSFMAIGLIGLAVRKQKNWASILGGTIAGSVLFYLVTNFAFFYPPSMYPHDLSGIMTSYYNAIPFFRNMLMGDLFYVGLLFGSYEFAAYLATRKHQSAALRETV